jgi:PadR family transcriptional regulator PadR
MSDDNVIYDLTGFHRDLLYVLAGLDDPPGIAIRDELEPYHDTEIGDSLLYRSLTGLIEKGLVEKGQSTEHRKENWYALTPQGQRELTALHNWKTQLLD